MLLAASALLFLLLLVITPITLQVKCRLRGLRGEWELVLSTWIGLKIPLRPLARRPAVTGRGRKKKKSFLPFLARLLGRKGYRAGLAFLLKHVAIRRLEWYTALGSGDPALTGVLVGGLWSVKGFILTLLARFLAGFSCQPQIKVMPCFTGAGLDLWVRAVFTTRAGYILLAALRAAFSR